MKNTFFASALLILTQLVCAQKSDTITVLPFMPKAKQIVKLIFKTDNPAFINKKKVDGVFYTGSAKANAPAATAISFIKVGKVFTTTITLPDTAVIFVVSIVDAALNNYKALASFVYDNTMHPLNSAYKPMTYIYNGYWEDMVGIKADKAEAEVYEQMMYDAIKDTMTVFDDKAGYYRFRKDTAAVIKLYTSLMDDNSATETSFAQAVYYAGRMKQKALSDTLTKIMKIKFPDGNWKKSEDYIKVWREVDVDKKVAMLQEFKKMHPDDAKSPNPLASQIQQIMAMNYANSGNFDAAIKIIPTSLKGAALASMYNSIAWRSCIKDTNLKEAAALSKASLDTLKAIENSVDGKPSFLTKAKYIKGKQRNYATYEDTYAFLLYKNGDYENAFVHEAAVLKAVPDDKSTVSRYHLLMEKVAPPEKVTASLADYIAKNVYDSAMEAQFKRLYTGTKPLDVYFAELTSKAQAVKTASFIKTMLNEPAAKFSLVDLDGNKYR